MRFRLFRLRFRRRLRKGQQQVEEFGSQAEKGLERHFFKRYGRLMPVRRFVIGWVSLMLALIGGVIVQSILLSNHYQTLKPVPGGIYNEGILGTFTSASPIYATSGVDSSVSRLVFAGLLTHDEDGNIVGDLAESYTTDAVGKVYTVKLKPNLKWHDGKPLTSEDVMFTYQLIQNPDAQSPFMNNWRGITIATPDPRTVIFTLPDPLAAFPHNLTNGIVPKHLLGSLAPRELRTSDFNAVNPIGAGPFRWEALEVTGGDPSSAQIKIALRPFADYARGKPKLQEFIVQAYASEDDLLKAFRSGQLTGVAGLNEVPQDMKGDESIKVRNIMQRAATMVFFKTSSGVLADANIRAALVNGANVPDVINKLGYPTRAVREPFLIGQLGYDPSLKQAGHDLQAARQKLDAAGWKEGSGGIRTKDGQKLSFSLSSADTPEYRRVTQQLKEQWKQIGVEVNLRLQQAEDFQMTLSFHDYDAVLYGIAIGSDPDVFVYWDSSQADIRSANRLNLSEYKNSTADIALESGRTRIDPTTRVIKYKPFLEAWQKDNPALGLYQPRFLYMNSREVFGLNVEVVNTPTDRFANVHNWQLRQAKVTN